MNCNLAPINLKCFQKLRIRLFLFRRHIEKLFEAESWNVTHFPFAGSSILKVPFIFSFAYGNPTRGGENSPFKANFQLSCWLGSKINALHLHFAGKRRNKSVQISDRSIRWALEIEIPEWDERDICKFSRFHLSFFFPDPFFAKI